MVLPEESVPAGGSQSAEQPKIIRLLEGTFSRAKQVEAKMFAWPCVRMGFVYSAKSADEHQLLYWWTRLLQGLVRARALRIYFEYAKEPCLARRSDVGLLDDKTFAGPCARRGFVY